MNEPFLGDSHSPSDDHTLSQQTLFLSQEKALGSLEAFSSLKDPRRYNARHPFLSLIFIALCAVLAGANNFEEIERWAQAQKGWLENFVPLPHGVPTADTFLRVFSVLSTPVFQAGFRDWTQTFATKEGKRSVIALDGKASRASENRADGLGLLHCVSAWSVQNRLVLGQEMVETKTNEIIAIPRLLSVLDIANCVVTIDAMGTQKSIAQLLTQAGATYILSLKENHPILHDRTKELFERERARDFTTKYGDKMAHSYCETYDNFHGRQEYRRCWVIPHAQYLDTPDAEGRTFGFTSVVCIEREFHYPKPLKSGQTFWKDVHYYITTLKGDASVILSCQRDHWTIENSLHWVLDMSFRDDLCRVREEVTRENFAILRHVAFNLLSRATSLKGGISAKRQKAGWNVKNLEAILRQEL
jgi:predicted transposase YbfD/YdcC